MPISTLVATAGSASANAYTTVAFADQFHLDRPTVGTTVATGLWSAATTDQKTAALLWATKLLDQYFEWNEYVTDATTPQALLWPRTGLLSLNELSSLDENTVPLQIQWATAEFARQLLVSDRAGDSAVETQGIKLLKAGSIRIDFRDGVHAKPIPDVVVNLIPSAWGRLRASGERELMRA